MMLRDPGKVAILLCGLALGAGGADFPSAAISNGTVQAKLYLPDPQNGYYQGTRFDWSGVIASLEAGGHNYFGKWFERYDPKIHDAIMGPVEEFLTDGAGLGYSEAKPGEVFVKIGVGAIRKPDEPKFRQFSTYEIVDPGKWSINSSPDAVDFLHEVDARNGYAYSYRKTVRLTPGKPELVLEHRLKNTGRKTIETAVYEHDFYMLDGQPTGPETVVKFPFDVHPVRELGPLGEVRGKDVVYNRELARGQTVAGELTGYGNSAADYDIRVENRKTGAAVRQRGDRPMSKVYFWSIRTTVCPEAYVSFKIEPGQEATWRIAYEFYTVPVL